jgi:hypothetical protein
MRAEVPIDRGPYQPTKETARMRAEVPIDRGPYQPTKDHPCPSPERWYTREQALQREYEISKALVHGCPRLIVSDDNPSRYHGVSKASTAALREISEDDLCCYGQEAFMLGWAAGRPLTTEDGTWLPRFAVDRRPLGDAAAPRCLRSAAQWLRDARMELASVASFRRAALELRAVGAPAALVRACEHASVQEARHASACLAIAQRLAGRPLRLGPIPDLPPRSNGLLAVLTTTFTEGCVPETMAALLASAAVRGTQDPEIRRVLATITHDETHHAELAWATIGWGWPRLSASEQRRWLATARRLEPRASGRAEASASEQRWGRLSAATREAVVAGGWRGCVGPLVDGLGTGRTAQGP